MDPLSLAEALPAGELLDSLTSYGINNVQQLAQQYAHTRKAYDSSIRYPGASAGEEAMHEFWRKIGRPETPEAYQIPDSAQGSALQQTLEQLRGIAHTKGLTADQWSALATETAKQDAERDATARRRQGEVQSNWAQKVHELFGEKKDQTVAQAQQALSKIVGDDNELKQIFEKTGLGNHPTMIAKLAELGKALGGDNAPAGLEGAPVQQPIDEGRDLAVKIAELMVDESFKKNHPKHEVTMQKFWAMQKRIVELGFDGATDPRLRVEPA